MLSEMQYEGEIGHEGEVGIKVGVVVGPSNQHLFRHCAFL